MVFFPLRLCLRPGVSLLLMAAVVVASVFCTPDAYAELVSSGSLLESDSSNGGLKGDIVNDLPNPLDPAPRYTGSQ